MKWQFNGPLFIVGWPRSGTKLLRDLLNRHPKISIPVIESHFIPYFVNKFGLNSDFNDEQLLTEFYELFSQSKFYRCFKNRGVILNFEHLNANANKQSWSALLEFILRYYASNNRKNADFIWGDKTPQYLVFMDTLKKIFPEAKFIHIIRDPRDCCLSNKRAWGKNIYRSAHRWAKAIQKARQAGHFLEGDYIEVLYEQLLDEPQKTLKNICDYLGCEFSDNMLELDKPSENLSDTKNSQKIVKDNKNKYLNYLSVKEIKRIEEIVYTVARELGYKFENDATYRPLKPALLSYYKLLDGFYQLNYNVKNRGLLEGINFTLQEYSENKIMFDKIARGNIVNG